MSRFEPPGQPLPQLRAVRTAEYGGEARRHGVDDRGGLVALRIDARRPRPGDGPPDEGDEFRHRLGGHPRQHVLVGGREGRTGHALAETVVGDEFGQLHPRGELGVGGLVGEFGQGGAQGGGGVAGVGRAGLQCGDEVGDQAPTFVGGEAGDPVHENCLLGAGVAPGNEPQHAVPQPQRADLEGGGVGVRGGDLGDGQVTVHDAADRGEADVQLPQDADEVEPVQGRLAVSAVAGRGAVGGRQQSGVRVEPDRPYGHAGTGRQFTDRVRGRRAVHEPTLRSPATGESSRTNLPGS